MKKVRVISSISQSSEIAPGPFSLRNQVTKRNEFLHPGMAFYDMILATTLVPQTEFDRQRVLKIMTTFDVKLEFQKLCAIKKNPKLKSDIICVLGFNIILNLMRFNKCEPQTHFEFLRQATRIIYSLSLLVDENPMPFKRDHERVCKFIIEVKAFLSVSLVPCMLNLGRYSDAILKAKSALDLISTVRSNYGIHKAIEIEVYSTLAIAYLSDNQLAAADVALLQAIESYKHFIDPEYQDFKNDIIQAIDRFILFYMHKDTKKLMALINLARQNLSVQGTVYGESLNALERKILPSVAMFFTERAIVSQQLAAVSEYHGCDRESGKLLIKFKSAKIFNLFCDHNTHSSHPFRVNILTNPNETRFNLDIIIESDYHLESFLSCCSIALEKSKLLEVKKAKPQQAVTAALPESEPTDPSFNPYAYADNLSGDLYPRTGSLINRRAPLKRSLELWKKELKSRREGEVKSPQLLPIIFEEAGCVYDTNAPCSVVAIEFNGTNDVWYGVLNPDVAKLIPVTVRQQIIDKFKIGTWEQAAYEDCRQEMKTKSKQTGNKDLKNFILKIRILGHEFGDIRIYGRVINTVENPNCQGRFCNLLAFTGFALNGHKDLPISYVMPKLIKDGSTSETDDTNSSLEDSTESNTFRSSLDM